MIVCQLDSRHHEDPPKPSIPIVIADKRALARTALVLRNAGHTEANVWRLVERCGVEDSDTVPAGLNLDGQMALETVRGWWVVEYRFERSVFECCAVDISCHPVVIEHWSTLYKKDVSVIGQEP
jgi:hypothetical protein